MNTGEFGGHNTDILAAFFLISIVPRIPRIPIVFPAMVPRNGANNLWFRWFFGGVSCLRLA